MEQKTLLGTESTTWTWKETCLSRRSAHKCHDFDNENQNMFALLVLGANLLFSRIKIKGEKRYISSTNIIKHNSRKEEMNPELLSLGYRP